MSIFLRVSGNLYLNHLVACLHIPKKEASAFFLAASAASYGTLSTMLARLEMQCYPDPHHHYGFNDVKPSAAHWSSHRHAQTHATCTSTGTGTSLTTTFSTWTSTSFTAIVWRQTSQVSVNTIRFDNSLGDKLQVCTLWKCGREARHTPTVPPGCMPCTGAAWSGSRGLQEKDCKESTRTQNSCWFKKHIPQESFDCLATRLWIPWYQGI